MADKISLSQNTDPELISLDTGTSTQVSVDLIDKRAEKAHYGMEGILPHKKEDYAHAIYNGKEDEVRREAASTVNSNIVNNAYQNIQDYVSKTASLSQEHAAALTVMSNPRRVNTASVFEETLAQRLAEEHVNSGVPWTEAAIKENPTAVQNLTGNLSMVGAKYAFARKMEEEYHDKAHEQSWGGYSVDFLKGMVPLYTSIKTRGLIPGTELEGGFLGGNLEEQRKALFRLPFDEFVEAYPKFLSKLSSDNPSLAAQVAHDWAGSSINEQALNSFGEISDLAVVGSIFKKPLVAAAKSFLRQVPNIETRGVRTAVAAANGDMPKAAVNTVAERLQEGMSDNPNPIKSASEDLASGLRQINTDVQANPGNFGADIVNRINATIEKSKDFFKELADSYRPNRTPSLALKEVAEKERQSILGRWRGVDNSILDMTDPIWWGEPNVYYRELHLGNADGQMFDSVEQARENARRNGYVISDKAATTRIQEIEAELKEPPSMEDDVHGLSLRIRLEAELDDLKKRGPVAGGYQIKEVPASEIRVPKPIIAEDEYAAAQQNIYDTPQGQPISHYGPGPGYEIKQQGPRFYINYIYPTSEVEDVLRDNALALKGSDLPQSIFGNLINATIGKYRTAEDTLSKIENENRKITTHTPSRFQELAKDVLEPIQKLRSFRRGEWKNLDKLLRYSQSQQVLFSNPAEVESWYYRNIGHAPSIRELDAYFAARTGLEMDRMLREISTLRNKWRQGVESHNITMKDENGATIKSPFFDARRINHLPNDDEQIAIFGNKSGDVKVVLGREPTDDEIRTTLSHFISKAERESLNVEINNGSAKVIKLWNPDLKPLDGFTPALNGKRIMYAILRTEASEVKPIRFDAVPRLGGGHLVPDYGWYSKQAVVDNQRVGSRQDIYTGDRTISAHRNRAEGADWIKRMNVVRQLIKDGNIDEAKRVVSKFMDETWDNTYRLFQERRDPTGKVLPPLIDKDQPIIMVAKNKRTIDMGDEVHKLYEFRGPDGKVKSTFKDGTRSGNDSKTSEIEFTGERNLHPDFFSVESKGSKASPLFTFQPARLIDPMTMLNRGLARIIDTTFMDDQKIFAVENYIQQAKSFMDVENINELRNSPMYHLFQQGGPRFKKGLENDFTVRQLKGNWKKVRDFIGIPSEADVFLRSASEKLQDAIYKGLGPKGAKIADVLVPTMTDPIAFVTKMAYHPAMGLYSIPQFFTQLSTHINLFALAPKYAFQGTSAMLLHSWSTWNESPKILAHLDKLASRMGWKPGWFLEARSEFIKSGFGNIGGDHIFQDTPWSAKLIQSGTDKFFSWGEMPFKLGAKSIRTSSFYTSYLEWRTANPTAELTRANRASILDRATLYDHNQSRASASALNQGIFRPAMQFQSYALRLAEMMYGKRLTPLEKARLFGVSAVLYGVPIGGLGLYAFPANDYVQKYAKDHGYVLGESAVKDTLMHGLASEIMKQITGHAYNFEKFGAKGIDVIGTGLDGDKTWMDIFGGASWSVGKNLWANTSAYRMWASSVINGDQEKFPITLPDVLDAAKVITSYRHANQGYIGMTTGRWVSSNENYLGDVTGLNSFFMSFTGLSPLGVPEAYLTQKAIKEREETDKVTMIEALKAFHRGVASANDPDQSKKFFTQVASFMAHYPNEKKAEFFKLAWDNNRPYMDRVQWNYFMKDIDPTKRAQYIDLYRRTLQSREK